MHTHIVAVEIFLLLLVVVRTYYYHYGYYLNRTYTALCATIDLQCGRGKICKKKNKSDDREKPLQRVLYII